MNNYTKHTGTEIPSELAGAQIIEWNINMDPMNGVNEKDRVDAITWLSNPAMGHIYYRPTLDPDGIPYCSAEGLEEWAEYVAWDRHRLNQFSHKPQTVPDVEGEWVWIGAGCQKKEAPETHRNPGDPADSLMRVWR